MQKVGMHVQMNYKQVFYRLLSQKHVVTVRYCKLAPCGASDHFFLVRISYVFFVMISFPDFRPISRPQSQGFFQEFGFHYLWGFHYWCFTIYGSPWEPTTFILRGYNPYFEGVKPSFFMVSGSKGLHY